MRVFILFVAVALGGRVDKYSGGWGVGLLGVALTWLIGKPGWYVGWFGIAIALLGFVGSVWEIVRR